MMVGYLEPGLVSNLWLEFLAFLNSMIYVLVRVLCGLFTDISKVTLFGDVVIDNFAKRIYVILGIYMLFKLAISLLNSIINPDHLLDKEKGMQKIIPRTVMALAMLILVPSVFELAFQYQSTIAEVVPRIIVGRGSRDEDMEKHGEVLATTALKAFFQPIETACQDFSQEMAVSQLNDVTNVNSLLDLSTQTCKNANGDKTYVYEFNGFVGFAAGIFMVVSLASYCVDIAIRSIKLGLLQLLAPIPIISYIDPKSEKDGAFGHWTKECVSTYLEVFIKLGILYFVIFILSQIATDSGELLGGNASTASDWVKAFLIIGAFFFMGKAADFICNIIGVKPPKEKGGFFKGLAGIAGFAGVGLSTIGSIGAGARAATTAARVNNPNIGRGAQIRNAIMGGALRGVTGGLTAAGMLAKNKSFMDIVGTTNSKNAQRMRMAEQGGTTLGAVGALLRESATGMSDIDALEASWKQEETAIQTQKSANGYRKSLMDRVSSKAATSLKTTGSYTTASGQTITGNGFSYNSALSAAKSGVGVYKKVWYEDSYGTRISEDEYNTYSDSIKAAFARQESSDSYFQFQGQEIAMSEGDVIAKGLMDSNEENYYDLAMADRTFDSAFTSSVDLYRQTTGQNVEEHLGGANGAKAAYGSADYAINQRSAALAESKNSAQTRRSQANVQSFRAKR